MNAQADREGYALRFDTEEKVLNIHSQVWEYFDFQTMKYLMNGQYANSVVPLPSE